MFSRSSRRRDGENRYPACFGDDLTIQLQHEPQNAVRSWMRRPHVEHHLLPISCCSGSRNAGRCATRVTGSGDSISRVVNGMKLQRSG